MAQNGTTVQVTTAAYYSADFRSSTSGSGNTLTYAIAWTSGPNNSSGIVTPASGLFLIPQDSTNSSVYTVTVTDGSNTTPQPVTVPAASTANTTGAVIEYYWNGTNWV